MPHCDCTLYPDLTLDNSSIYRRVQDSKRKFGKLGTLNRTRVEREEFDLLECRVCGQFWQSTKAILWGGLPYLFKVPAILQTDWLASRYIPPDLMCEINKAVNSYKATQTFHPIDRSCQQIGCDNRAIELSVMCYRHHLEMLQRGGTLPNKPEGRLFAPYKYDDVEKLFTLS